MTYEQLLNAAPDHLSDEFLDYLREKNVVVYESERWLIIENFKYHTKDNLWWTAFYKESPLYWRQYVEELERFKHVDFLIKSPSHRTVGRPHVHLIGIK